ncbi:YggT family protein [Pseudopontixanthobacter vadosimaris]|uniref:YggT family protein n=1 Tax=Pseudopontixanthobacter vadosimaris TaxID=2726450 RepID=UPI00147557E5
MFLITLLQIVELLTSVLLMLIIVQFVIGLLFAFNVVNQSNQFAATVYNSINTLLEPVLAPIRRILPRTGAIDFSPLVLIIILQLVEIVLRNVAVAAA